MRSYIFTTREQRVIHEFLGGRIHGTGKAIGQILWRMRTFKDLSGDVDLYLELRRRLAKAEST